MNKEKNLEDLTFEVNKEVIKMIKFEIDKITIQNLIGLIKVKIANIENNTSIINNKIYFNTWFN